MNISSLSNIYLTELLLLFLFIDVNVVIKP